MAYKSRNESLSLSLPVSSLASPGSLFILGFSRAACRSWVSVYYHDVVGSQRLRQYLLRGAGRVVRNCSPIRPFHTSLAILDMDANINEAKMSKCKELMKDCIWSGPSVQKEAVGRLDTTCWCCRFSCVASPRDKK